MQRTVFALIGAGGISQSQHLSNLTRADGIRLKTVCDLDPDKVRLAREEYGVPHGTTDVADIWRDPEIEAVVIATKAGAHEALIGQALDAGKHVYVEKPLADTEEEIRRIAERAADSDRLVAVGHNRRMAPAIRRVKELADAHGGVRQLRYRIADAYWHWGRREPPGQRVIHEICHIFDLVLYLTGSDCRGVYTAASRDDEEVFVLTMENGSVATILSSGYAHFDLPKESLELMTGKTGVLQLENFVELRSFGIPDVPHRECFRGHLHMRRHPVQAVFFDAIGQEANIAYHRAYYALWLARQERGENAPAKNRREMEEDWIFGRMHNPNYAVNKGWVEAQEHFAACIREGRKPLLTSPAEAHRIAAITAAAIRSRESGQVESP